MGETSGHHHRLPLGTLITSFTDYEQTFSNGSLTNVDGSLNSVNGTKASKLNCYAIADCMKQ
eukprot:12644851-Heterocapsa_arctica.AAC.1